MNTNEKLLQEALEEIKNLNSEEVFLVKDLFKGYIWNRIPLNNRLRLGRSFLYEVEKNSSIIQLEKNVSGQQKYKKI